MHVLCKPIKKTLYLRNELSLKEQRLSLYDDSEVNVPCYPVTNKVM